MKYTLLLILSLILLSCSDSNKSISGANLQVGDSLFVDSDLRLEFATRIHETNSKAFVDGHAQVDSNKIVDVLLHNNLDRKFFFDREESFIGTFQEVCTYDKNYIILKLDNEIEDQMQKSDSKFFGKKIKTDKKKFYSGEVQKMEMLENFPNEMYINIDCINTESSDTVFSVLN